MLFPKSKLFGVLPLFFIGFNSYGLDYQSVPIAGHLYNASTELSNTSITWTVENRVNYKGSINLLPMSERIADALNKLDVTKQYKCDMKIYDANIPSFAGDALVPLYDFKNCTEVSPPSWPIK